MVCLLGGKDRIIRLLKEGVLTSIFSAMGGGPPQKTFLSFFHNPPEEKEASSIEKEKGKVLPTSLKKKKKERPSSSSAKEERRVPMMPGKRGSARPVPGRGKKKKKRPAQKVPQCFPKKRKKNGKA